MTRDLYNRITVKAAISPIAVADNTAQVGNLIDGAGYESLTYAIETGTLADADATFAVTLQEGDLANGSDLATVAAGDLIGALPTITFASDNLSYKVGYRGTKRYTKLTITPSANSGSAPLAAVAILGHARHQPAA